jgi:hypothetical protein
LPRKKLKKKKMRKRRPKNKSKRRNISTTRRKSIIIKNTNIITTIKRRTIRIRKRKLKKKTWASLKIMSNLNRGNNKSRLTTLIFISWLRKN